MGRNVGPIGSSGMRRALVRRAATNVRAATSKTRTLLVFLCDDERNSERAGLSASTMVPYAYNSKLLPCWQEGWCRWEGKAESVGWLGKVEEALRMLIG